MSNRLAEKPLWNGFSWPVKDSDARVSSAFGCRKGNRYDPRCPNGQRVHNGIDIIANNREAPIFAVYGGIVRYATQNDKPGFTPGFGNYGRVVVIEHLAGPPDDNLPHWFTLYAHLSSVDVSVGQRVTTGQKIGNMGRTAGNRQNPDAVFAESVAHLHFETSPNKYPQSMLNLRGDPLQVLRYGPDFFVHFPFKKLPSLYNLQTKRPTPTK